MEAPRLILLASVFICNLYKVYALNDFDAKACGPKQPVFITDPSGDVYSPGYTEGKNYANNMKCSYVFQNSGQGQGIEFSIQDLDIEVDDMCGPDQILIRDSDEFKKTICGREKPNNFTVVSSWITLYFESDFMVTGRGFHIKYQLKKIGTDGICGFRRFLCKNNNCVPNSAKCNYKDDCGDGSDETNCPRGPRQEVKCGEPIIKPDLSPDQDRVVGGRLAVPGSWPWQVDLQIDRIHPAGHVCGGTLINELWIVTAAHCFTSERKPQAWRVRLGSNRKYETDEEEQVRRLERFIIYGVSEAQFLAGAEHVEDADIALVKMNAPVKFTDHVRPACLPPKTYEFKTGTKCFASGFGDTRGSGNNDRLKQVGMEILDMNYCKNEFIATSNVTMVCAGNIKSGNGVCHGDSGGPLVCEQDGKFYLAGVLSFLTSVNMIDGVCAMPERGSIFTKVTHRREWISKILNT